MISKLTLVYVAVNFLFVACGGLLLGFSIIAQQRVRGALSISNVATNLLLTQCPLTGKKLGSRI
jgi:hypothetical protein